MSLEGGLVMRSAFSVRLSNENRKLLLRSLVRTRLSANNIEARYSDCGLSRATVEQIGHVVIDEYTRIAQLTHSMPLSAHR